MWTEISRRSVSRGQDAPSRYLRLKEFAYALKIIDLTLRTTLIGNHEKVNSPLIKLTSNCSDFTFSWYIPSVVIASHDEC